MTRSVVGKLGGDSWAQRWRISGGEASSEGGSLASSEVLAVVQATCEVWQRPYAELVSVGEDDSGNWGCARVKLKTEDEASFIQKKKDQTQRYYRVTRVTVESFKNGVFQI